MDSYRLTVLHSRRESPDDSGKRSTVGGNAKVRDRERYEFDAAVGAKAGLIFEVQLNLLLRGQE